MITPLGSIMEELQQVRNDRKYICALTAACLLTVSGAPYAVQNLAIAGQEAQDDLLDEGIFEEEEWDAANSQTTSADSAATAAGSKDSSENQGDAEADNTKDAKDDKNVKGLIEDKGPSNGGGLPEGLSIAGEIQAADPDNQIEPMVQVDPSKYPAASFSENAREVYWYCRLQLGLNHAAACGVLGNVHLESSFRPLALGDGGTSYGICQWHLGRLTNLMAYCEQNDLDYNTIEGQLAFLSYELNGRYNGFYQSMKDAQDTPEGAQYAGWLMCVYFEMPDQADARGYQRGNLAMNNYYPKDFFESAVFATAQEAFIKSEATAVSDDLPSLPADTKVLLQSLQDGWAEIVYDRNGELQTGFIPARLLSHVKEEGTVIYGPKADISAEEMIMTDTSRGAAAEEGNEQTDPQEDTAADDLNLEDSDSAAGVLDQEDPDNAAEELDLEDMVDADDIEAADEFPEGDELTESVYGDAAEEETEGAREDDLETFEEANIQTDTVYDDGLEPGIEEE